VTASTEVTCAVCGEAAEELTSALCGECDRPFHLNQRNDVIGKDCGDVWVDEQYLSLRFACFTCLRGEAAAGSQAEPPVGEGH
jgi:hypothetical protein